LADVDGVDETRGIIFDLYPGTATNVTLVNIDIDQHDEKTPATVLCDPATLANGEQDVLGFKCADGEFVKTEIKPGGSGGTDAAMLGHGQASVVGVLLAAALTALIL